MTVSVWRYLCELPPRLSESDCSAAAAVTPPPPPPPVAAAAAADAVVLRPRPPHWMALVAP